MNQVDTLVLEVEILRDKLDIAEAKNQAAEKAVVETELKIRAVMKRLLTANDVKGDKAMRENILEQMNDLNRNVMGFFASAGLNASNGKRNEIRPIH
jgi:hypothetical protein